MMVEVVVMTMQHTPTLIQPYDVAMIGGGVAKLSAYETRQAVVPFQNRQFRAPLGAIGRAS